MAETAKRESPDTAARIRSTALDLFTRQGYERTSLREIAEALGITKAAIYYHYRSKVEILDDIFRPAADAEEAILAEFRKDGLDRAGQRLLLVERYVDLLLEHRTLMRYVVNDIVGASSSSMVPRLQRHDHELARLLAAAGMSLHDRVRTLSAIGVIMAVVGLPDVPAEELRPLVMQAARDVLGFE